MWNKIKRWAKRLKEKAIRLKNKAKNNLKNIGWFGGVVAIILSLVITFAPTIGLYILFIITRNQSHLISASAWATFIIAPAGGTGALLFFSALLTITTLISKIKNKIGGLK